MEIGAGIFWGAVVLAIVILYVFTKDRWKWKKIAGRTVLGAVVLGTLIFTGLWGVDAYKDRLVLHKEFLSISIDDSIDDVKFKKGEPPFNENEIWAYKKSDEQYESIIKFKDGKVRAVMYVADCSYCERLHGLGIGSTYNEVINRLGFPTYTSISDDALERLISYQSSNLVFQLKEGKVIGFGIYNPMLGSPKFNKEKKG